MRSGPRERYQAKHLGPRQVGGRYHNWYWNQEYTVELIRFDELGTPWLTVRWADGHVTTHCTAWDAKRDRIIADAEAN